MSDRPLSRKIVKLIALITGPSTAHRQDIWPHLTINRTDGRVAWRGRDLLTLSRFSNIVPQRGKLLAIVGSGPSLGQQHPQNLPPRTAILLNGAATLAPRITPCAVAVEDERFIFRHIQMLADLPQETPLLLSPAALRAIAELRLDVLADRPIALIDNLAKPVNRPRRLLDDPDLDPVVARDAATGLSRDPDTGVVIVGTVAFSALQIALAATPQQIVLAGIDLSNAAAPRFYEKAGDTAPSGIITGLDRSLAAFALARDYAGGNGIALTCASPISALLSLGIPYTDILE